jgi:kanamycin kinase/aminoglycoside 3'-phosphotransferase-2
MSEQFINWAKKQLGDIDTITKEAHGDQSEVFRLQTTKGNFFLKISKNLEKECERLKWLRGRLPVPEVIGFIKLGDKDALLLSAVEGVNLSVLSKEWPAEKIVAKLAQVLQKFHSTEIKNCPFEVFDENKVLVHGDACLPNFIFKDDNFSGYIDLGDMGIDNPEVDLAAAVWSLQYNLGSGYGLNFLRRYGIKNATEELVDKLRLQYEDMQREWGLMEK